MGRHHGSQVASQVLESAHLVHVDQILAFPVGIGRKSGAGVVILLGAHQEQAVPVAFFVGVVRGLADVLVIKAVVNGTQLVAVVKEEGLAAGVGAAGRLHGAGVVVGRCHNHAVPPALVVVGTEDGVGIAKGVIGQEGDHAAVISVGVGLSVLGGQGKDDFLAGFVANVVNVMVVGGQGVGAKVSADDGFAQRGAFREVVFLDEHRGVEQQAGLDDAVGGLVHAVHVVLGKVVQALVQFLHQEVVDDFAALVKILGGRAGNHGGHLRIQRKGAAPHLKEVVVAPRAKGAHLVDILRSMLRGHANGVEVHSLEVMDDADAFANGTPGVVPGLLDNVRLGGPGVGGQHELLCIVPAPLTAVPNAPGNLVGRELVQVEEVLTKSALGRIINGGDGSFHAAFVLVEVVLFYAVEGLFGEVEAGGKTNSGNRQYKGIEYLSHKADSH